MWVADAGDGAVARIDPGSGVVVDQIPVGGEPGSIASGGGAIWVASTVGATVTRVDPTTEAVTQTIVLPGSNPVAIAFGDGRLWVADSVARELFEIDPATGSLRRTVSLGLQPAAIALAGGAIWVAGYNNATVEKLDPTSGRSLARVHVGDGPAALAFAAGSLWVANSLDATVSRVDPATRAVTATIPVGSGPTAVASAGGSVWVANQYSADVSRINPGRDRVADNAELDGSPTALTPSTGRVWVGVAANSGSHRGGTLVIDGLALASSGPVAPMSIDPAFYSFANNPQFTGLEYDSLVNFQQSAGAAGLRLVPDLALSIPTPTDGGTTYMFRLRPGIHYSSGQPLRAGDFRRAIERLFRVGSPGSSLYIGIAGAAVCARRPRSCDLSHGIVTHDSVGTVTFHLAAPDPDFLFKLTEFAYSVPVPPGTPDNETGSGTVPGTGPYKIVAVNHTEIRFVRNPFFREWSHAAQPTGNPNSIVWRTVPSAPAALTAIEQRRADWFLGRSRRRSPASSSCSFRPSCTQTLCSGSSSSRSTRTCPRSMTSESDGRSTLRSTEPRSPSYTAVRASRPRPASRSRPPCPATVATAPTHCNPAPAAPGAPQTSHAPDVWSRGRGRSENGSRCGEPPMRGTSRPPQPRMSPASYAPSATASAFA